MGVMLQIQHAAPSTSQIAIGLALFGLIALVADYARMLLLRQKMPPGPLPWPVVGNTFQLPDVKPWIYFETLAKRYNTPVITYWIGRNPTVWICEASAASEILDKRASIYSSRPRMIVFGELSLGQSNIVSMFYGDRWRLHRKLTHMGVGLQHVRSYSGFQNNESRVVALDLVKDPADYVMHFERYAASVVSIIGFNRRIKDKNDPIITDVIAIMQRAAELNVPGKTFPMLMETFPVSLRIAGRGFKANEISDCNIDSAFVFPQLDGPWKHGLGAGKGRGRSFYYALAEEAAQKENHGNCYAKKIMEEAPKYGLSNMEIASLNGNLFGAGSDTSSSTLITFILACCAFPEVLPKAWEELDRVVGSYRSPGLDDDLPYIRAFMKEVFRWRSVAIIGGQPHAPIRDDYYRDWYIPKNTWVQGNVWAIHRNEKDFPEPDRFAPERFIEGHPLQRPFPNEKGYMTFGWGRRVCSGQGLAEQGTFLTVARLLWGFNIQKALHKHGQEIPVDIFAYTNGLNMRPEVFDCRITPRSPEIRETIEREGKQALAELAQYDGESKYRASTFYLEDKVSKV